eukprot:scaffold560577_cov15-Prasinocladus_malaysianus.AAC.1
MLGTVDNPGEHNSGKGGIVKPAKKHDRTLVPAPYNGKPKGRGGKMSARERSHPLMYLGICSRYRL